MSAPSASSVLCRQQPWQARAAGTSGRRGARPTLPQQRLRLGGAVPSIGSQPQRPQILCRQSFFEQAWGTSLDYTTLMDTLPQNLFAVSIIPYAGFLYHLHRSKQAPPMTLFGFYFLLAFVFATIPAGIYAKKAYGLALANVDWLHGSAESLLTLTNLFIVLGLRDAIRKAEAANAAKAAAGAAQGNGAHIAGVAAEEQRQPVAKQE